MKFKFAYLLIAGALMLTGNLLHAQLTTKISGEVTEAGAPLVNAEVILLVDGQKAYSTRTNEKGEYSFVNVDPGKYSVLVWHEVQQKWRADDVVLAQGETKPINMRISESEMDTVVIPSEVINFKVDEAIVGKSFGLPEMTDMGARQPDDIAPLTPGVIKVGNALSFRGARTNGTAYYVDGMKLIGPPTLPRNSIQNVFVITGGVPAEFGDFTGGVISVTTRNPGMRPDAGGFKLKPKRKKKSSVDSKRESEQDSRLPDLSPSNFG